MTFTCTKCGNYSDNGDFEARICLRCIDDGADKEADKDQEQREWHHIDVPTVRPLTPNEQKVYSLLRMGYTAKDVARQLRMPYGNEFFCNVHDVTCDTVRHLITSIREKGWDISEKSNENEEEKNLNNKYTEKQRDKALKLIDSGMTQAEVAKKLKISRQTISLWVVMRRKQKQLEQNIEEGSKAEFADDFDPCEFMSAETPPIVVNADTDIEALQEAWAEYEAKKEEPASAATDTDSESESLGKNSDIIIPENIPAVKGRYFSTDTITAIEDKIAVLSAEQNKITERMLNKYAAIDKINASIAEDDALNCGIQFRIDELKADLDVIRGGVVHE